nr:hypothetical protein [Candidatus Omnitrophota bacterium]
GIIRYFFAAGILSYAAYLYTNGHLFFMVLLGPPIHLASFVVSGIESALGLHIGNLDLTALLPATMIYFCFMGFLIKQLLQEKPVHRILTLTGLLGFLVYIHFLSWRDLSSYLGHP